MRMHPAVSVSQFEQLTQVCGSEMMPGWRHDKIPGRRQHGQRPWDPLKMSLLESWPMEAPQCARWAPIGGHPTAAPGWLPLRACLHNAHVPDFAGEASVSIVEL